MSSLHIYTRVSTVAQEEGSSLDTQEQLGRQLASKLGLTPVVWNEGAQSSAQEDLNNRPVLSRLLLSVDEGEVSELFVYNTDRLSRNDTTWQFIRLKLVRAKVNLHTASGLFKLGNQMDKIFLTLMSEISSYDNYLRTSRTVLGKHETVKKGFWLGGPPPFGYRLFQKKLVEEKTESKWVKFIYRSYKDQKSVNWIRNELIRNGVLTRRGKVSWSLGSIEKILTNTHYRGYYTVNLGGKEAVRCSCPQIVPSSLITQCIDEKERRSRQTRVSESNLHNFYFLRGFLFCKACGSRMSGRKYPKQYRSIYYCPRMERNYVNGKGEKSEPCGNRRYLKIEETDSLVWDVVLEVLAKSHHFKEQVKRQVFDSSATYESSKEELKTLKRSQVRLKRDIEDATNTIVNLETDKLLKKRSSKELSGILAGVEEHRLRLAAKGEEVAAQIRGIETRTKWVDWLSKFGEKLNELSSLTMLERQNFLKGVITKIEVDTLSKQEHQLTLHFLLPYVDDQLVRKSDKSGRKSLQVSGGNHLLTVGVDSSKKPQQKTK